MSESPSAPNVLRCPECGEMNPADANFCSDCGSPIPAPADDMAAATESATTAISVDALRQMRERAGAGQSAAEGSHVVAYRTDIGKKHHVNQDAGNAWTWTRHDGSVASLLIVADGVSAGRHSEAASRLAVEVVYGSVSPLLSDASADSAAVLSAVVVAVKEANHQVAARPHAAVANADATTIVVAYCIDDQVGGAWVGDSRVYQIRGADVFRLTVDHSWAEGMVSRGLMTVEQAARDPRAHMIMRWLGPPDQDDPGVDIFQGRLAPGDIVFCCTDGLYGYFSPPVAREDEIVRVITSHGSDLEGALDDLVRIALARGGHDNITIAALRRDVDGAGGREPETQEIRAMSRDEGSTLRFRFPPEGSDESAGLED